MSPFDSAGGGAAGEHCSPPSAAGHLEPYGVKVSLRPSSAGFEPEPFLESLLEDLAAACLAAGASMIGHLKCLLRLPVGTLACNLTSVRSGASCTTIAGGLDLPTLGPGKTATLDLAVLVYGLAAARIDTLTREVLASLLGPSLVTWRVDALQCPVDSLPANR